MASSFVDLNIIANGETASPLQKLLQEIDIIMTAGRASLVTNYRPDDRLDKFLFKSGVSAEHVRKQVENLVLTNLSTTYGYRINFDVKFVKTKAPKDLMYIEIQVETDGRREKLSYVLN
jgi:hypothetical protein